MSVHRVDTASDIAPKKHSSDTRIPQFSQDEKIYSTLAYIGPFFVLPLLFRQESDFCQFHARQGFKLFLINSGLIVTRFFPLIGSIAHVLLWVSVFLLGGYGIFLVWTEKMESLPFLHSFDL